MPIGALTSVVTATAIDWPAVEGNLDTMRAWVNGGMLSTDVVDGTLVREHFVRPELFPAPIEGQVGRFQSQFGFQEMQGGPFDIAIRRQRESIKPFYVETDEKWRTTIGKTIEIVDTAKVFVSVQCHVKCIAEDGVIYPDGASGAGTTRFGSITLASFNRVNQAETEYEHSRYYLYPEQEDTAVLSARMSLTTTGKHDIYLMFQRGAVADPSGAAQIDISRVNFVTTVLY